MSPFIIALNAGRLVAIILLGSLWIIGLGWILVGPLWRKALFHKSDQLPFVLVEELPLIMSGGLLVNFVILLLLQSLQLWLWIGLCLGAFGLVSFGYFLFEAHCARTLNLGSVVSWTGIITLSALYLVPMITRPLVEWDARSIWFFHAKVIYSAGGLVQNAGWGSIAYFAHPDYPKLVSSMAAEVAYLTGFWNEYLPKAALFFVFFPFVMWLFSFIERSLLFAFLFLVFPFAASSWVWNGYMDGFIYLYFSLGLLLLGRYFEQNRPLDLVSGWMSLSLTLHIKNEGALALSSGLIAFLLALWLARKPLKGLTRFLRDAGRAVALIIFALLPWGMWALYKRAWGLQNDLMLGTSESFLQVVNRLSEGSLNEILKQGYIYVEGAILLLVLFYLWSVVQRQKVSISPSAALVLLAALIYALGIVFIYLATPHDLN